MMGYDEAWQGASLRKLPMWGDEDLATSFEWPTEEAWNLMDPNTSITSIDFASNHRNEAKVAWCRVHYSDGEVKTFENINPSSGRAFPNHNHDTVSFDVALATPIRAVKAASHKNGTDALNFLDAHDQVVTQYNPFDRNYGKKVQIAENEEIIGVYGNNEKGKTFRNFGFIVKVKPDQD